MIIRSNSIGIYGGSFDPFHEGHRYVIKETSKSLDLKVTYLVPTYGNPLKKIKNNNIYELLNSLRNSTAKINNIKVTPLEYKYKSQSTSEFVKKINYKCSLESFVLIIGLDQLWDLHKWTNYKWIVSKISICIIQRPGYDASIENSKIYNDFSNYFMTSSDKFILSKAPNLFFLKTKGIDISSTKLRDGNQ